MAPEVLETTCCVVGGGPAGIMLGYLLARRGVQVIVLEKHQDFFRDFRGDTVHPSTLQVLSNVNYGKALILINRSDYFQAGLIIRKGSYDEIKARGLDAFRSDIRQIAPYLGERVNELRDWEQIKILTVQINRLPRWHRPGLLCIGDAAHAMSPAGGVGINLAIQDAVAAANLLA